MLYKILDLLASMEIKCVFIGTSMKHDVVDSFEKRIKSRFSNRTELMYHISLDLFIEQVHAMLMEKSDALDLNEEHGYSKRNAYMKFIELIESGVAHDVLVAHINNGK